MSTNERPEVEFVVGKAQLTPGVDAQAIGMSVGEKKSFTVAPAEGFGGVFFVYFSLRKFFVP